jgi:hypothetical protein
MIKINDFSIEYKISKEDWEKFKSEKFDYKDEIFTYLQIKIDEYLKEGSENSSTNQQIAMIALDYNYGELLNLLTKRGTAIKEQDEKLKGKIEDEIDEFT